MFKKIFFRYVPFLILVIVHLYSWCVIITTGYDAGIKHMIAALLLVINSGLYLKKISYGLMATAIVLLLSVFNLIQVYTSKITTSYFVVLGQLELSTPPIDWRSVVLLIVYFIFNTGYWIDVYADYKYKTIE